MLATKIVNQQDDMETFLLGVGIWNYICHDLHPEWGPTPLKTNMTLENPYVQSEIRLEMVDFPFAC